MSALEARLRQLWANPEPGMVLDPAELRRRATGRMADSLRALLAPGGIEPKQLAVNDRGSRGHRFRPKKYFRSPRLKAGDGQPLRVAVLPFANESLREDAGDVMAMHFVRQLARDRELEIVEPGVVRQALLESRLIMVGGLSFPQAELLREMVGVDLVFVGSVTEYQDYGGPWGHPVVVFSATAIDTRSRQIAWTCMSYNRGDDGVFFFDWRRVHTAHQLASSMVHEAIETLVGKNVD